MPLTEKEIEYMGAKVRTNKNLEYPKFTLPVGSVGTIYDFGRSSGDPFVDFGAIQCIVPWEDMALAIPKSK